MFHSNFINHQQCLANGGFWKVFLFVARWSRGMPILVIVEKGQDVSFLLELSPLFRDLRGRSQYTALKGLVLLTLLAEDRSMPFLVLWRKARMFHSYLNYPQQRLVKCRLSEGSCLPGSLV